MHTFNIRNPLYTDAHLDSVNFILKKTVLNWAHEWCLVSRGCWKKLFCKMCCFYAGRKKLKTSSGWVLQFLMDSNPLYLHKISIRVPSHSDEVVCHINAFTDSYFSKQDLCFFYQWENSGLFYKTFHCKLKSFLLVYCKMHIL